MQLIREIHSPHLFTGNALDARDLPLLYDNGIAAIVDLAMNEPPAQLSRDMIYCRVPILDGEGNLPATIETSIRCLVALIENDFRTLVACSAGMSRSLAIAAAAIAVITGRTPDSCLLTIAREGPHDVSPILWSHVSAVHNRLATNGR